jgi:hydrogenase assembly chaperone HypC/HupF
MCISKPQRVLDYSDGVATVDFMGRQRKVSSPKGMELKKGDWVICQSSVVAQKIPEKQAKEMLKEWKQLNEWK